MSKQSIREKHEEKIMTAMVEFNNLCHTELTPIAFEKAVSNIISQVEKEVVEKILKGQPVLPPESKEYSQGWVDCNEEWLDLLQAINKLKE